MRTTEYIAIDAADAAELVDLCGFLRDWIAYDPDRLADSLWRFSPGGYPLSELRDDLSRFAAQLARARIRQDEILP